MDFSKRTTESELMDTPGLDKNRLIAVYRDLDRVNRMLGGENITVKAVGQILNNQNGKSFTIVDVGCGSGGMLRALARYGRKKKIALNLIGIDLNENALEIAREASELYPEISFLRSDILSEELNPFKCDILICTLTLHHLKDDEIPVFLKKFASVATLGVVINDLQRSRWAYYLFKGFSTIFIKTKIAKNDGLISIRRGFVMKELKNLSSCLPKVSHNVQWKWAFRYAWVMHTNHLK